MKNHDFSALPRRIFLDSCTVQTMYRYGAFVFEHEPLPEGSGILGVPSARENLEALWLIFRVNERAGFEWMVSDRSFNEATGPRGCQSHAGWLAEVAHHAAVCLADSGGLDALSIERAARLEGRQFGYLSLKDRLLLQDAIALQCDAFLTMEKRLPRCADHLYRETGLLVLNPLTHWRMLEPWARLWC